MNKLLFKFSGNMTLVNVWCVQAIHQKILSLGFQDCHAKIRQVDCQETVGGAVVIQVVIFSFRRTRVT
jgi:Nuclear transport factor 2 (NTF2) domain